MFGRAVNGAWYGLSFAINLCMIRSRAEKKCSSQGEHHFGLPAWQRSVARFPRGRAPTFTTSLGREKKKTQNKSGRGPFIAVMCECTAESTSGGDDWSRYMAVVVFDCKSYVPVMPETVLCLCSHNKPMRKEGYGSL